MHNKPPKKRPPVGPPLRYSGQSGDERFENIFYYKIFPRVFYVFVVFSWAFRDWLMLYFNTKPNL
jgi:hypothetical protein